MLIIAIFLLSLSGCGFKAAPYYEVAPPKSDKNVDFFIKKKEFEVDENNESCQ
jgi:predicted small lipoprotein YifL